LSQEAENMTVTLLAPSKTFNIAGLGCSVAIIPNPEIRQKFNASKDGFFPPIPRHSMVAALSAYRDCEDWRLQLINYLKANNDYLYEELNGYKGLRMLPLEATYLSWIDSIETGIPDIQERILKAEIIYGRRFFKA
jgi:cysteine-S-conjugate beta-lyase